MQFDRFSPFRKPARRRHAALKTQQQVSAQIETVEQRCLLSAVVTGPTGTVTTPTPTITWSTMDGAASYDLWISEVTPKGEKLVVRPTGLTGTSYTAPALPDGTFRVWVRTNMDDGSKTPWSPSHDFEVDAARITGPTGKVSTPTPEITWDSAFGATSYDLWISQIGAAPRNVLETPTALPGLSYTPAALPEGRIRVWVRANFADGSKTAWSAFHDFEVDVPAAFTAPSVVGGDNPNLTTGTPTLEWTAAAGNQRFEIFLSDRSRLTSRVIQVYDATRRSYTFGEDDALAVGRYEAFIRTVSLDGTADDWGSPIRFRIGTPPEILRPFGPSFQNPPILEWASVPGATSYDVWLSKRDTPDVALKSADKVEGTSYRIKDPLPKGEYSFKVRARHDGAMITLADGTTATGASNVGEWTALADFETLRRPDIALVQRTMEEPLMTTAARPTLRWTAIDKAARYDLWIDWSAGPAQYVRTNVRDTEYTFENTIPAGRFFAWVRAVSERGEFSDWSAPEVFEASGGVPVITGPTGVLNDPFPTIEWIGVPDAVSYEIWISTDTTITPIVQQTGITGTSYEVNSPLAEGKYRVWVRATLLDGTMTNWTRPFGFEISTIADNEVPTPTDAGEIIPVALNVDVQDSPLWLQSPSRAAAADSASQSDTDVVVVREDASANDERSTPALRTREGLHVTTPATALQHETPESSAPLQGEVLDRLVAGWHRIDWWSNESTSSPESW